MKIKTKSAKRLPSSFLYLLEMSKLGQLLKKGRKSKQSRESEKQEADPRDLLRTPNNPHGVRDRALSDFGAPYPDRSYSSLNPPPLTSRGGLGTSERAQPLGLSPGRRPGASSGHANSDFHSPALWQGEDMRQTVDDGGKTKDKRRSGVFGFFRRKKIDKEKLQAIKSIEPEDRPSSQIHDIQGLADALDNTPPSSVRKVATTSSSTSHSQGLPTIVEPGKQKDARKSGKEKVRLDGVVHVKGTAISETPPRERSANDPPEPHSVAELPVALKEKLSRSGLSDETVEANWWMVLAILQFVGKTRFSNPWKEDKKDIHGPTGRDFRGEIEGLFENDVNPHKLFRGNELLGVGGFGSVYLATRRSDGSKVAIKKMPHSNSKEVRENSWEVGLLKACQHPNVVELYGCYGWQGEAWVVMEYLEGGSLADAVAAIKGFKEEYVAYAARETLEALEYIHAHHYVHRDLKSANFVFTVDASVKIIDFGLGRDISRAEGCTMLGSPFWMPPEMVNYDAHGTASDIWSFAISMIEMVTGHPPNYYSSVKALFTTGTVGIDLSQFDFSESLTDFLSLSLRFKPSERATATQLKTHAFLDMACSRETMKKLLRTIFVSASLNVDLPSKLRK